MSDFLENQVLEGFSLLSAEEKTVVMLALDNSSSTVKDLVYNLCYARRRAAMRAASDRETDKDRRILVGARLNRPLAEKYRACARERGLSLYRFVCNALEREYRRLTE